jgi:malonate-semialdehyde dehydrogenase (acetylating)/methylmalonate-semialdehyde dehydrogenase
LELVETHPIVRTTPFARRAFSTQFPALQRVSGVDTVKNYINGKFVESKTDKWIELRNPVSLFV